MKYTAHCIHKVIYSCRMSAMVAPIEFIFTKANVPGAAGKIK